MLSVIVVIFIMYSGDKPEASVITTSNSPVFSTVPYILSTVTKTSDTPEVIVTVVDNGNGQLVATVNYPEDGIEFSNKYTRTVNWSFC